MVKPYHLHGANFKAIAKNEINDLANEFALHCMRLDDAKGAVLIVRPGFYCSLARED